MQISFLKILPENALKFVSKKMRICVKNFAQLQEWTVDIYSVTGSGGSEKTYSAPNSAAYVMIPNDNDVAQAKSLIEAVLNETP